jgi:hypothetical protein
VPRYPLIPEDDSTGPSLGSVTSDDGERYPLLPEDTIPLVDEQDGGLSIIVEGGPAGPAGPTGPAGPAGVAGDHGALTGLADDDHTQYQLAADLGGSALLNVGTDPSTVAAGDDSRFTSTVATSRLGTTGTASETTFLRGDQAWAALGLVGAYKTTTELVLPGAIPGVNTTQAAYSPDTPFIDITGDIDIRMNLSLTDWTPPQDVSPLSKWGEAGNRSWYLRIKSTGELGLIWSADGTTNAGAWYSTVPSTTTDGVYSWVRATLRVDNGENQHELNFYTSTDGVAWTQLGTTRTFVGTTSIFSSSADLSIGSTSGFTPVPMSIKRITLHSTIGGATPAPFDVLFSSGAPNARVIQEVAGGNNGLIFIAGLAGTDSLSAALNSDPRLNDQRRPVWPVARANNTDRLTAHDATSAGYFQIGTMTGPLTFALPALAEIGIGKAMLVYSGVGCSETNTLTVQAYGTETINGTSSSYVITEPNRLITFYSNTATAPTLGPNWVVDAGPISVKSVSGTGPISSTGGITPQISVSVGTTAGTVAAGDDSRFSAAVTSVTSVTGTAPIAITGTSTAPNVTLGSLDASQTTTGIFTPARLGSGTADANAFLRGDSTWSDDVPLQISVKNTSGGALTKGTPVYATGTVGATAVVEVAAADASNSAKMPAIGLLLQDLSTNATGLVTVMGTITSLNTDGYSINSPMYVAPGGGLTNTRPTAATDLVQNVARVTRVHATTGEVLVLGPGRTNDVPNLIATNFLATSGTASATTFLRGDQSWSTAVTSVTGTAPIVSSGSSTDPAISISAATVSAAGSMSAADKTILNTLNTGYKVISKTTIASATASVDIDPTGYSNIKIVVQGKSDYAGSSVTVRMKINGITAAQYLINGSAATTSFNNNGSIPGSLTNTNRQGYWECDFAIGGVGNYTVGVQRGVHQLSTATTGNSVTQNALIFANDTAAITSILVYPSAGNFEIGSKITVLGLV